MIYLDFHVSYLETGFKHTQSKPIIRKMTFYLQKAFTFNSAMSLIQYNY